ncbi:glutamate-rich WD repeat-containing protein 1-like [Macrobrachium rosenbergii]|uniref:glutamate-rich WD repeat-containing protein 1-like n=1 Tax=Macrobrachium rosenbergii TaxID=79674 RepID=UPI0034D4DFC0
MSLDMDEQMELDENADEENPFDQHGDDNDLECDFTAYELFHEGSTGAPCLSFDIIKDGLGDGRTCDTPVTCYFIAGTQTSAAHVNNLILMKMKNLHKIKQATGDDSDDDSELEDDEDEGNHAQPIISSNVIKHEGCVNRIRSTVMNGNHICASWSELGRVHIWDMKRMMKIVDEDVESGDFEDIDQKPLFTFKGHCTEGFALDWSSTMPGTLATGDCEKFVYLWSPKESTWSVSDKPYEGHTASVEDIQWSPNEAHVFASCSVDKSIRVWDDRAPQKKACMITVADAHNSDVNVIHWNRNDPFIVSGGDDGFVKIWDLRQIQGGSAVAKLKHHTGPITTVEWHPKDPSVFASGSEDNQILQWDLSVERDPDVKAEEDMDIPQQLLFEHQGQKNVKELHWHPQIPGLIISTAESGFHVFKTISC